MSKYCLLLVVASIMHIPWYIYPSHQVLKKSKKYIRTLQESFTIWMKKMPNLRQVQERSTSMLSVLIIAVGGTFFLCKWVSTAHKIPHNKVIPNIYKQNEASQQPIDPMPTKEEKIDQQSKITVAKQNAPDVPTAYVDDKTIMPQLVNPAPAIKETLDQQSNSALEKQNFGSNQTNDIKLLPSHEKKISPFKYNSEPPIDYEDLVKQLEGAFKKEFNANLDLQPKSEPSTIVDKQKAIEDLVHINNKQNIKNKEKDINAILHAINFLFRNIMNNEGEIWAMLLETVSRDLSDLTTIQDLLKSLQQKYAIHSDEHRVFRLIQ